MKAWIARDHDGLWLFDEEPVWFPAIGGFASSKGGAFVYALKDLSLGDVPINRKQQITLTATPAGEAKRGAP